jgi:Domain of unknown function (DUF4166)
MSDAKRILLLGATGMFGRRLADRLVRIEGVRLVLASRSKPCASALAAQLGNCEALEIRDLACLPAVLAQLKPFAVIDCSGPFQGASFTTAKASLEACCHFIDIADARDYLVGFSGLDGLAKRNDRVALAGASSTPCLSTAVVREVTRGWKRIDTIDMAIAPDGHNNIGLAVAQGTLSYAGNPVQVFRHGKLTTEPGWLSGHRQLMPGVGHRHLSLAETVDAELLSRKFAVTSRVTFSAGLYSQLEHRGLQFLSWLRARSIVASLAPMAPLLLKSSRLIRKFGKKTGGMRVAIQGLNAEGQWTEAEWSLAAQNGVGPYVPILPIVAAVKLLLQGALKPGARMAIDDIPLAAITDEMKPISISTRINQQTPASSIFEDAVPPHEMARLPRIIADFHKCARGPIWQGRAQITRSSNLFSRLVGRCIGLPKADDNADVRVSVERKSDGTETWTRFFNGKPFRSVMNRGDDNGFWERFGPLNFKLPLRVENGVLHYPITKAKFFHVPLPRALTPKTTAFETVDTSGRFVFDVKITLPFGIELVHYRGWLRPQPLNVEIEAPAADLAAIASERRTAFAAARPV